MNIQEVLHDSLTAIEQVKQLHNQWHLFPNVIHCAHCSHAGKATDVLVEWPCPTLQALEVAK